jgi:O-antigen/teichoic acid export membrane protein
MKSFLVLALAVLVLACAASAGTYNIQVACTSTGAGQSTNGYSWNNPPNVTSPPVPFEASDVITCGGAGVIFSSISNLTSVGAYITLNVDYSGGANYEPVNSVWTTFTPTGLTSGLSAVSDTIGVQGFYGPSGQPAYQTGSLGFWTNPFSSLLSTVTFQDNINTGALTLSQMEAAFQNSFSVNYTVDSNTAINAVGGATQGAVQTDTGQVYVWYTYTTTNPVPEPVSMLLFGSGLLGLSIIGRKKLGRR